MGLSRVRARFTCSSTASTATTFVGGGSGSGSGTVSFDHFSGSRLANAAHSGLQWMKHACKRRRRSSHGHHASNVSTKGHSPGLIPLCFATTAYDTDQEPT